MNSFTGCCFRAKWIGSVPDSFVYRQIRVSGSGRVSRSVCRHSHDLSFRFRTHHSLSTFCPRLCTYAPYLPLTVSAKKRTTKSEPILKPSVSEEVFPSEEEDDLLIEEFEDDELLDEEDFLNNGNLEEEVELYAGDGSGGGGVSFAGTPWDKKALEIAEEVALSFDGELGIYAFKTLKNANIQVRVERFTNKSGSPSMMDIEDFSLAYRERLDEAESLGSVPNNLSLEVSSPGVERVVRIPEDLDRFKDRPMHVKYTIGEGVEHGPPAVHDGVFRLMSFDVEKNVCTWGLADVKVNRGKAGKGRPLSKKQKEWCLDTPFASLLMVRLHSDI
ncbi:unnamed protein product [Cuscuta epithymum]|uniref:DUF7912 domain-containing protein n=1 Tax=Cuscuta epithymum TaxID=186058 RepID=A0AAV0CI04_9ASTE|nr:unnamed protein product [Cuscuta epithymum]